ncbi:MAG: hypothetical protein V9E82_00100 [Candidatus Nanopelagicales bacterium]
MSPRLSDRTRHLLRVQHDLVASWQVPPSERSALRRAGRRGGTTELTYHVFHLGHQELSPLARAWAAVLHCGPHARLGGRNALVLHGWAGDLQAPFDIVVPTSFRPHEPPPWITVRRLALPGTSHLTPPRVLVADAAVEAAAWSRSQREAMYLLISVMQQRLTTADRILASLSATTRHRRLVQAMVTEYRDGIQSVSEYDFSHLCRRYGLPRPVRQTPVRDARGKIRSIDVEFRIGSRTLRLEVEGSHHLNPDSWLDDIDRHNGLALAGHDAYLRVATFTIRTGPGEFMTLLGKQLAILDQAA